VLDEAAQLFIIGISDSTREREREEKIVLMIRTPQQQGSVHRIPQIRREDIIFAFGVASAGDYFEEWRFFNPLTYYGIGAECTGILQISQIAPLEPLVLRKIDLSRFSELFQDLGS
jgi:hypothetical protein